MAIYEVQTPDGKIYEIEGPENTSRQAIADALRKHLAVKAPAPSTERTALEAVTDVPVAALKGLAGMAQFPGQVYGLATGDFDTAAMRYPQKAQDFAESLKSKGLKAREERQNAIIAEAAKNGVISEGVAAVASTIKDPALFASFIAEQVPQLLPALLTGGAYTALSTGTRQLAKYGTKEAAEAAARAGAAKVAIGTGIAQQGADVGADTYKEALDLAEKQYPGMSLEDRQALALSKARATAVEAGIISLLAQRLPGGAAIERRMAGLPGEGRIRSALGEAASELVEEGGGKFASNVNLQQIDPTRSLTQGVGQAAGLGAIGGGVLGGAIGRGTPAVPLQPGQRAGESLEQTAIRLQQEILNSQAAINNLQQSTTDPSVQYARANNELIALATQPLAIANQIQTVQAAQEAPPIQTAVEPSVAPEAAPVVEPTAPTTTAPEVPGNVSNVSTVNEFTQPTQKEQDATKPVAQPSGGSPAATVESVENAPAPSVGGVDRSGVVPAKQDAGVPVSGEGTPPAAVTPVETPTKTTLKAPVAPAEAPVNAPEKAALNIEAQALLDQVDQAIEISKTPEAPAFHTFTFEGKSVRVPGTEPALLKFKNTRLAKEFPNAFQAAKPPAQPAQPTAQPDVKNTITQMIDDGDVDTAVTYAEANNFNLDEAFKNDKPRLSEVQAYRKARESLRQKTEATPEAPKETREELEQQKAENTKQIEAEIAEKKKQLTQVLKTILTRMGLKDVSVKLIEDINSAEEGSYADRLMRIAVDANNPLRVLKHETIHALKELGFFTDSQWKSLVSQANSKWIDKYLKSRNVELDGKTMSRYDAYMVKYNGNMDMIVEEAIADAFGDFSVKAPPGMLAAITARMKMLFQGIKSALNGTGFYTSEQIADQIFTKTAKGQLKAPKQTASQAAYPTEAKLSLRAPKTEAFKNWFGDSKVVDDKGEPLVVYHGTSQEITEFEPGRRDPGVWFTSRKETAAGYAKGDAPNLYSVYLSANNPLVVDFSDASGGEIEVDGKTFDNNVAIVKYAQRAGYDSVNFPIGNFTEDDNTWVVFRPEQIKSATGNNGTYSKTNPDIRYSLRDKLGMYSELENKIEAGSNKAPAASWKAYINGLTQKGVKPDEIEWSGVKDWLDLQKGTVTKDELLNYLKEGGVKVEETVLGKVSPELRNLRERMSALRDKMISAKEDFQNSGYLYREIKNDDMLNSLPEKWQLRYDKISSMQKEYDRLSDEEYNSPDAALTKYGTYTLPGGENYREVLLTLPVKLPSGWKIEQQQGGSGLWGLFNAKGEMVTMRPTKSAIEEIAKKYATDPGVMGAAYKSTHWDQPNVLAHIRLNDRTDADGNKVLFVEEVQSDWGQGGKKYGFIGDKSKINAFFDQLRADAKEHFFDSSNTPEEAETARKMGERLSSSTDIDRIARILGRSQELAEARSVGENQIQPAPFVTKTEGWLNLALKRIMVMAAEGGYDKVAFVNGLQSHERFPQKQDGSSTRGSFSAFYGESDGRVVDDEGNVKPGKVPLVQSALSKLLPKVGGGQMKTVEMSYDPNPELDKWEAEDGESDGSKAAVDEYKQPGFDVTPAMQDKVKTTGLPRFSLRNKTVNLNGRDIPVVLHGLDKKRGDVLVPVNTKAFDDAWEASDKYKSFYIGPKGTGNAIKDRYERFADFSVTAKNIEASSVSVDEDGNVGFGDGRHRWSFMRDQGVPVIPVAMSPESLKNAEKFGYVAKSGNKTKFSLRSTFPQSTQASIDRITTAREEKGFIQRITEAIAPTAFSKYRQQYLNRYNQLGKYDKLLADQLGVPGLLADASSEATALQSDLGAGLTASALGVHDRVGGIPVFRNGITVISNVNGTVGGPMQIFAKLTELGKGDPYIYQSYQLWAGAKRASRFNAQGVDTPYTAADLQEAQRLEAMYPEFKQIQKDYIKFNDGLVQYMLDTGIISKENAKKFSEHADYIPFYRQLDGEETIGPNIFQSISGVKPPKKIKGGEAPLADFMETIVRNTQSIIQAGVKNTAAQRAVNVAMQLGPNFIKPLNYASSLPSDIMILENGLKKYYRSSDPLWIESLKALNAADLPFNALISGPANLLRTMVTKDPGFMLANMMRDSLAAYTTSGIKMVPIVDTIKNFTGAIAGKSPEFQALLNAGILGGHEFSQNIEYSGKVLSKELRKKTGTTTTTEKVLSPFTGLWSALEKGTTASDAATRMEVYKKTLAETGNEAEALFRALEVMNFNRKGSSPVIRVITAAFPFLNARIQGLDVLYRAGFGQINSANAAQVQRLFFIRGAQMMALSAMYWALTHDDEEYKKQESETRDNYWLLPSLGIKIPIPFEIGILFKVIPERILAYSFGDDTGQDFMKSMARQLMSTLAVNPIPQTALPIVEAVTNHSFFTQRPIVGQGLEGVEPGYQVGPGTTNIAADIGKALNISPMKLDHMIKGYSGTMGMYLMDVVDSVYSMNSDIEKPSKRLDQMPVLKRFMIDPEARGTVTAYYEMKNAADQAVRTSNLLERTFKFNDRAEYLQENGKMLVAEEYVKTLEKTMKQFREMRLMVRSSNMSGDDKQNALNQITAAENKLTSNIQAMKKALQ